MEEACRVIGIDIGNSGLRIAELEPSTKKIGRRQRITWRHASAASSDNQESNTASSTHPATEPVEPRFAPDSEEWLGVIDQFLMTDATNQCSCTSGAAPCKWLVSSVRRDAMVVLNDFATARAAKGELHAWKLVTRHDLLLNVDVLEPDRVGIDRLLAAAAAADLFSQRPLIVMQVGSAMTVDLVTEPNTFAGGAILPGVPMMLRLLGQAADMLPEIDADELTDLPALPGRNTEQAMRCGTASALIGGAQHLVDRYRQLHGEETPVILSGGDGNRLSVHIPGPVHTVPELVLQGLMRIQAGR